MTTRCACCFIESRDGQKTRRIFNKVNRHAKPTGRSDNIITSEDDGYALVTRRLLDTDLDAPLRRPARQRPAVRAGQLDEQHPRPEELAPDHDQRRLRERQGHPEFEGFKGFSEKKNPVAPPDEAARRRLRHGRRVVGGHPHDGRVPATPSTTPAPSPTSATTRATAQPAAAPRRSGRIRQGPDPSDRPQRGRAHPHEAIRRANKHRLVDARRPASGATPSCAPTARRWSPARRPRSSPPSCRLPHRRRVHDRGDAPQPLDGVEQGPRQGRREPGRPDRGRQPDPGGPPRAARAREHARPRRVPVSGFRRWRAAQPTPRVWGP